VRITDAAIRYRTTVLVLIALLVVVGVWSYVSLPKEATPSIEIPIVTVITIYPGASPDEVETLVTFPIERELQGIDGVDEIRSTSREGVSFVRVEFASGVSLVDANQRVRERVDLARVDLPADAEEPRTREIDVQDIPVMTVNLVAAYPLAELQRVAERLQDEIEAVPGVLEAELTGGVTREVQVEVDLTALQGYGLSFDEVARVIEQENTSIPGGSIDVDRFRYQVRVDGRFDDPARIADLVVRAPEGRPVYVRDVAEVVPFGFEERGSFARIRELRRDDGNGRTVEVEGTDFRDAVSLSVSVRSGENVLEMVDRMRRVIDAFEFPSGTEVVITGDRSENVAALVEELENHIIFGVLLVTLSLLFFLGLRTALLAAVAIPLTLLLTFAIFFAMGQTLNFIILFSLIIVLGILVDFAIIVVENVQRYRERGHDPWEAARLGTDEVAWPVTAGLVTTMAVFVPLLFWEGRTGEFLRFIPLTLIITLIAALFVALIMVPVIAGYVLGGEERGKRKEERGDGERGARNEERGGSEGGGPRGPGFGAVHSAIRNPQSAIAALAVLFLAAVVGVWNPITLLVLVVAGVVMVVLYRRALRPGTEWFRGRALPRMEAWYRGFLGRALERDYTPRRALLRNAAALAAFAAGAVLLVLGFAILQLMGRLPAMVALVPGGVLAAAGVVGIVVHSLETLFLGGRTTLRVGVGLAVVMLPFVLASMLGGGFEVRALVAMLSIPLLLVVVGALGAVFGRRRRRLILTDNRARVLNLALGAVLAAVGALMIAPTGTAFFPRTDPNQIRVDLDAPVGTRIENANATTERAVERIEALLASDERSRRNVENIVVNVGVVGAGPFGAGEPDARRARITLNLVDYDRRAEPSSETLRKVRRALERFPGARIEVDQDRQGPPIQPPVQIEVYGPEFDRVASISREIEDRLSEASATGRIPGLVDVVNRLDSGQPEVRVRVDRERASLFGLSTAEVAGTIRAAVQGRVAGTFRDGEDEYDIRVRLREEDRRTLQSLEALRVGDGDVQVPLLAVAELELGSGVGAITRLDLRPVVTVEADTEPGFNNREVLSRVQALLADYRAGLPAGYTMEYAGEAEQQEEGFGFLGIALLLGIGLVTLVLVTKFNSVAVPVIILVAVGLTMSGVILGLVATRTAFGLFTFLGVISLAGIVADDDIVLNEFILAKRAEGLPKREAIIEGSVARFRQVVLTAVTTIVGLVPLTFGLYIDFRGLLTALTPNLHWGSENTQFWGPLGTAIIAGLPAATVVTLLVVPVVFSVFDSIGVRGARFFGRPAERGALRDPE
jgi:multidrug efflux pump